MFLAVALVGIPAAIPSSAGPAAAAGVHSGPAATAAATSASAATGASALPARVYDPYFETWTGDSIDTVAARSGARFLTLAFIQTPRPGSCRATWNGEASQPISAGRYATGIAQLRRLGGNVVLSFGGYSADSSGTDIADSCTSVSSIAAAYESAVTVYGATRLDLDVEAASLHRAAGIERRNEAVHLLERWAAAHHRTVQVQYTLPVGPGGLAPDAVAVVKSAVANRAVVSVNLMAFDYFDGTTKMAAAAISALEAAHRQLSKLYPSKSSAQVWSSEAVTLMAGLDDNPRRTELTSLGDGETVLAFARARGLHGLSMWAIQRDNGGCPGRVGRDDCSGIAQTRWAFSHLLEPFSSAN